MLGIFFLALGAGGLVNPGYLGMHLNLTHTLIHLVTGAVSFYVGVFGTVSAASVLCLVVGLAYSMLAFMGLAFGGAGEHTVAGVHHGPDSNLIRIIPGMLELGMRDHLLHAGVGAVYLVSALLGWLGNYEPRDR